MRDGIYSVNDLKALLAPAFSAYPVSRGYIFGSYARNEATESSDIDLFVEPSPDFRSYDTCGVLSRAMQLSGKSVDCYSTLDFDENAPIYKKIIQDRVLIYAKEK